MTNTFRTTINSAVFAMICMTVQPAYADSAVVLVGAKSVTTGVVIRGTTVGGLPGLPGTTTRTVCNFGQEEVGMHGRMLGASVNCRPNGNLVNTIQGLPLRFDAYCIMKAPVKSARLIEADVPGNPNHCDLSGITPKDATGQFKGAVWR